MQEATGVPNFGMSYTHVQRVRVGSTSSLIASLGGSEEPLNRLQGCICLNLNEVSEDIIKIYLTETGYEDVK
jgi:hypothetical protein